jgi:ribulose 1,5-bisphosphate carboxylase large subunit-like protein
VLICEIRDEKIRNMKFEDLKVRVQEIIDLIAAKQEREANNKLLEVSDDLDEMLDHAEEDEDLREISRYQVLLNQLHVKINGEEQVDGE